MQSWLIVIMLLFGRALASAQVPDSVQIYRTIKLSEDTRAGDLLWIEIWETQARDDWQWVMIDVRGTPDGVESTCYHAVALGGGAPIYFMDDELVPVSSAATLRQEIENRRLVDQSLLYVEDLENFNDVQVVGTDTIAGIPSEQRTLTDQDAANLFLIKPPATSVADLWTAVDGGFVTRYRFRADGSTGDVSHTYDLLPGGTIQPPSTVNLQCFNDGFPLPDGAAPLVTGSLTHGTFNYDGTVEAMRNFYQETLTTDWESGGNTPQGGRIYTRTLDNGSTCRLGLQFQNNPNGGTVMTARVNPDIVSDATFAAIPDEFISPVVVAGTAQTLSITLPETVDGALAQVLPDLEASGDVQLAALTDIREDSAFVALRNTTTNADTYVIVDHNGTVSNVRVLQQEPICGPTFTVP
jgi:hypothetical protein